MGFPNSIYRPRTKQNYPGVVYDPNQTTVIYAEDLINLDNEVVAIENWLFNLFKSVTIESASSITPPGDGKFNECLILNLNQDTIINAPSGTYTQGNRLTIRIKDDGTERNLSWHAIYNAPKGLLPTKTTPGKHIYVGFIYNSQTNTWDLPEVLAPAGVQYIGVTFVGYLVPTVVATLETEVYTR